MSRIMKDSGIIWIGEIPKHWNVDLLSRLFKEHKRKNINLIETNLLSLSYGKIIRKDINTNEGLLPQSFEGYNILSNGDIVFRLTDLQNDKRSLRTGLVREDGIITSAYVTIRKREPLNSSYFHYLFHSYDLCKVFYGLGDGVRQGMNFEDLKKILIIVPTLKEQQAIVDFLDNKCIEIDALIALQEKIIDELKFYKQAVITEAVTKGLNPNAPMKDSSIKWIGEIPEHWNIAPFKTIYRLTKGLTITKSDLVENGIPVISYGQIHSKLNNGTSVSHHLIRYVPDTFLNNNVSSLVREGDIIFADTSEDLEGCGNCVYIDKDITLFAGYHTIIAKNTASSPNKYLAYLFKTHCWRYQLRTTVNGVKLFSISQKLLAATNIILPSATEQQEIVDYLDQKCAEIDELSNIKQQKIDKLKEYKKSIIYEYVTGKKQVKI